MKDRFPKQIQPELAVPGDPPTGDDWLHETKFDGYRICCFLQKKKIKLISRNQKDWTEKFADIATALNNLPAKEIIFDGEIVALDDTGVSRFQLLQNAFELHQPTPLYYYIFDILYLDGKDLTKLPLIERKQILTIFIKKWRNRPDNIRVSEYIVGNGVWVFQQACQHGLEGIIAKRCNSHYLQQRTHDWLKCKCLQNQEFVIGGYSEPSGSRQYFGALFLGYYHNNTLIYCGQVGTGFNQKTLKLIYDLLKPLAIKNSAFTNPPKEKNVHWVKPELVCEVNFLEWTEEGVLRQASFQGLRRDKAAKEIIVETSITPMANKPENKLNLDVAGIHITNPDKILYPDSVIKKIDLIHYYEKIAKWILPHIIERPLTIVRCPEGINHECFYQRHHDDKLPTAIHPVKVAKDEMPMLYIKDLAGLIALIQMGTLEIHPWGSRIDTLQKPDRIIFDLDPGDHVAWDEVVTAAQLVRDVLKDLNLTSFVKLTGGKGLHVVLPILPQHSWDEVKEFSKAIAMHVSQQHPKQYVATMTKSKRKNKIFIDYLRNAITSTAIAPYSTRARAHAPLAIPVNWKQLPKLKAGNVFTLKEFSYHIKNDPWEGFFEIKQGLPRG